MEKMVSRKMVRKMVSTLFLLQRIVEHQIKMAEREMEKANQELVKGKPDKAIMRLSKAWLHSQFAIKFANIDNVRKNQ